MYLTGAEQNESIQYQYLEKRDRMFGEHKFLVQVSILFYLQSVLFDHSIHTH